MEAFRTDLTKYKLFYNNIHYCYIL